MHTSGSACTKYCFWHTHCWLDINTDKLISHLFICIHVQLWLTGWCSSCVINIINCCVQADINFTGQCIEMLPYVCILQVGLKSLRQGLGNIIQGNENVEQCNYEGLSCTAVLCGHFGALLLAKIWNNKKSKCVFIQNGEESKLDSQVELTHKLNECDKRRVRLSHENLFNSKVSMKALTQHRGEVRGMLCTRAHTYTHMNIHSIGCSCVQIQNVNLDDYDTRKYILTVERSKGCKTPSYKMATLIPSQKKSTLENVKAA